MAGFQNDVMYAQNVDFTGASPPIGQVTLDGQLLIGSSVAPFIRANSLTAGTGISITNGHGTIIITNTGGGGGGGGTNSLMGNSGSATQIGGVINVFGSNDLTTSGSGQTLTIAPTGNLLSIAQLTGAGFGAETATGTWVLRTLQAGSGITITNPQGVAGDPTISASPIVPTQFTADSGTAAPSGNNLNVLGTATQGISTSAAGSTVTLTVANATSTQKGVASFNATEFTVTAGAVTSNGFSVTAGTGLSGGGSDNLGGTVTISLSTPVSIANGGTGDTSLTLDGVLYGNGTSPVGVTGAGSNGQVLIGATGAAPAFATVGGTQGVTLTTGANSLSIGLVNVPNSALANSSITVAAGTGISVAGSPVSLGGTVTISAATSVPTTFTADSGTATPSANNLNILGTSAQGISTSASGASVTITAANATTTTKGVASFNSSQFTVSSGAVSLIATGFVETLTPNSGAAISPSSSNINVQGLAANSGGNAYPVFTYNGGAAQLNIENRTYLTPYVVDASTTNGSKGTFTTIAAALTQASADSYQGDIFIRPGTYTENPTLPAGINLTASGSDGLTGTVIINGNITCSGNGTSTIYGIQLQTNSAAFLTVSGSSATVVNIVNCFLNNTNTTGISYTNSNASSRLNIYQSFGDILTTGISLYTMSSAGSMTIFNCQLLNSGNSTTASSSSNGTITFSNCNVKFPISTSSSAVISFKTTIVDTIGLNTTALTLTGTASNKNNDFSKFLSGTATAITIGSGVTLNLQNCIIGSTNASVISGAGTLAYSGIIYVSNAGAVSVTTVTRLSFDGGQYLGNTAGTAPAAGYIGEQIRATVASGSAVALTSTVAANVTSIALTPGTWDVSGIVLFTGNPTVSSAFFGSVNTTSATLGTTGDNSMPISLSTANFGLGDDGVTIPAWRVNISANTTCYLVARASFSLGSVSAYGRISATRVT